MSISKAWYVTCENCGNPATVSTESPANARVIARSDDGFVRRRVDGTLTDLCMACRDKTTLDGIRPEWTTALKIEAIRRGINQF